MLPLSKFFSSKTHQTIVSSSIFINWISVPEISSCNMSLAAVSILYHKWIIFMGSHTVVNTLLVCRHKPISQFVNQWLGCDWKGQHRSNSTERNILKPTSPPQISKALQNWTHFFELHSVCSSLIAANSNSYHSFAYHFAHFTKRSRNCGYFLCCWLHNFSPIIMLLLPPQKITLLFLSMTCFSMTCFSMLHTKLSFFHVFQNFSMKFLDFSFQQ